VKFFRALEFNKLQFLLNEDQYIYWIQKDLEFDDDTLMNWWLADGTKTVTDRKKIISTIAKNPNEKFFNKSAEFNSVYGGRFNPAKSFGGIYCSNSAFLGALEVLYHYISNSLNTLRPISSNKSNVQTIMNNRFKNRLEVIIVSFEFECNEACNFEPLNENVHSLKDLCRSIGFERYITENFDRNFLFGNDYEISRHIGCHLHTQKTNGFSVPSARVDFDCQDLLRKRNFFIPEKEIPNLNLNLTGNFKEFKFSFSPEVNPDSLYDICLYKSCGKEPLQEFHLQPVPKKTKDPFDQIISYEHKTDIDVRNLREVHTQQFLKKV